MEYVRVAKRAASLNLARPKEPRRGGSVIRESKEREQKRGESQTLKRLPNTAAPLRVELMHTPPNITQRMLRRLPPGSVNTTRQILRSRQSARRNLAPKTSSDAAKKAVTGRRKTRSGLVEI
jgi:hypothetical protein